MSFDKDTLEAPAGTITIELANESPFRTTLRSRTGASTRRATGESTSLTVELQSGTYTFYCSVPGHREGGMEGTFTVG